MICIVKLFIIMGPVFFKHGNTHHIDLPYVNWNGTYTYVKSITLKDFDNDNDLDILFGHERGNNSTLQNGNTGLYLQFLRNDGNQTFTDITSQHFLNNAILLAEKYSDDQNNYNMAVLEFFDMNNDGHEDIVMTKAYAPIRENAPFIFLNDGNDFYKPVDHEIINNESEWFGEKAYPIDLNNDGLLDIVTLDVRPGPDNDYNTGDEYSELIPIIALKAIGLESTSSGSAKILLYPNPSNSNTVFIKNQSDFTNAVFELNTLSGSLVFSDILMTSNNEYIELKIPDLKAGIYILSIKTDFEVYTAKLILNN